MCDEFCIEHGYEHMRKRSIFDKFSYCAACEAEKPAADPYEEGRIAYLQGKPLTANPYHLAERFELWSRGWRVELDIALESCPLPEK